MPTIILQSNRTFIQIPNNQNNQDEGMLQHSDSPLAYDSGVFCGAFDYDAGIANIYVNQGNTTKTSNYMNRDFIEYQYNKKEDMEKIPQMGGYNPSV